MLFVALGLLPLAVSAATGGDPLKGLVCGTGDACPQGYVPPLLGNGELSMTVDWTCGMRERSYAGIRPAIYWAGRRLPPPDGGLFEFGKFNHRVIIGGVLRDYPDVWEQELDVRRATLFSRNSYTNGLRIESEIIVPLTRNLIAFRRTLVSTATAPLEVTLDYIFQAPKHPRLTGTWAWRKETRYAVYSCRTYGNDIRDAMIAAYKGADEPAHYTVKNDRDATLSATFTLQPGERKVTTFFIQYEDTLDSGKLADRIQNTRQWVWDNGFNALLREHEQAWAAYHGESSIEVPEPKIQRMIDVAQYHLRVNATRWSFPVGIFPGHWHGKYFGWDEMFCHQGLLLANHVAVARRCPEFRKALLKTACARVSHYSRKGKYGARYLWESYEDGRVEGAPQGFWLDHIFHMSNIAKSVWTQYLYSGDLEYLQKVGYPVLIECARYYRSHWVYEDSDGTWYIGKCTDLERLGPARERPFMTTCGAIYTLRAAADAAERLHMNLDEAADFRTTADKLVASLPHRDGAYIAYKNCTVPSVATLGGLFPYPIFDKSNDLQREAAYRFIRDGRLAGNMYPVGKQICPWYAGKMAVAMTLLEDNVEPVKLLREAAGVTGLFGETFEINEPGTVVAHPWFSTASGNVLVALCHMLLHNAGDELRLGIGVPDEWKNYAFRLPAHGGLLADACVKDGRLATLRLTPNATVKKPQSFTLVFREGMLPAAGLSASCVKTQTREDGKVYVALAVNGPVTLLEAGKNQKGL